MKRRRWCGEDMERPDQLEKAILDGLEGGKEVRRERLMMGNKEPVNHRGTNNLTSKSYKGKGVSKNSVGVLFSRQGFDKKTWNGDRKEGSTIGINHLKVQPSKNL